MAPPFVAKGFTEDLTKKWQADTRCSRTL